MRALTRVSIDLSNKSSNEKWICRSHRAALGADPLERFCPATTAAGLRRAVASAALDAQPKYAAASSRLLLHVDLEAEVDFGGRHSAADAPIFRRDLNERDLDIKW